MAKFGTKTWLIVEALIMSAFASAQVSYNPSYSSTTVHRVSVGAFGNYYYGDICPVRNHPLAIEPRAVNLGGGLEVAYIYQAIPCLGLRATLNGGYLHSDATNQSWAYWTDKGKQPRAGSAENDLFSIGSFQSFYGELDFGVEWYPIPHREGGLFLYAGLGLYMGSVWCDFSNTLRNPGKHNDPGWRTCLTPVGIGEIGYSFRLTKGHTLSVKASVHNGLINVNSKKQGRGYSMDGWGRGDVNSADFDYTPNSGASLDDTGKSAFGQFTDGYFMFGVSYTFNAGGDETGRMANYTTGKGRNSFAKSARVNPYNKRAATYKRKVSKARNKAFHVKRKKRY